MTRVKCLLNLCKYNSSCCTNPSETIESYCTKKDITLEFDEEMCAIDCKDYSMDLEKPDECNKCQIKKHGAIEVNFKKTLFDIKESDDIPY